jgi:homoserine O-acetyltransferase
MVNVQAKLVEHLGIESLMCVTGGSMGGMQAMEWAVAYPERVRSAMIIASTSRQSAQAIAFDAVGRNAIISDPDWKEGIYANEKTQPERGLAIARMIGHITYLSDELMHAKFGRKLQEKEDYSYDFTHDFQVESYLAYKGSQFVERFDANSYLYITKAMDYFDLVQKHGSLRQAFAGVTSKFLVVSFSSDWLYPPYQSREIVKALLDNAKPVTYCAIQSSYGHDAFLLEVDEMTKILTSFLKEV